MISAIWPNRHPCAASGTQAVPLLRRAMIAVLCISVLSATEVSVTLAQEATGRLKMEIPFNVIRKLLPADGVVVRAIRGPDGNFVFSTVGAPEDGPFDANPTVIEVTLGQKLRAAPKHRNQNDGHRQPLGAPGLAADTGFLHIAAGWRAKRADGSSVQVFDGTATAKLELTIAAGAIVGEFRDVKLDWNKGLGDAFFDIVTGAQGQAQQFLTDEANKRLPELLTRANSILRPLFDDASGTQPRLQIQPGMIVLASDAPNQPPAGPWAIEFIPVAGGADAVTIVIDGEFWNPRPGDVGRKVTWCRSDVPGRACLPSEWQGRQKLRVVAIAKPWGSDAHLKVWYNDRMRQEMRFSKEEEHEVSAD